MSNRIVVVRDGQMRESGVELDALLARITVVERFLAALDLVHDKRSELNGKCEWTCWSCRIQKAMKDHKAHEAISGLPPIPFDAVAGEPITFKGA